MSKPFNGRGAVDLAALAAAREAQAKAASRGGPAGAGQGAAAVPVVIDVTDASFRELIETSATVPVVIDLWATWCGPCKQLSPILERVTQSYGGRVLLAKVDVDANPGIAQAFQVQSIPAVFAILKGQPVPLFQGAIPEAEVTAYFEEILRVAASNGVTGMVPGATGAPDAGAGEAAAEEPEFDPRFEAAYTAVEAGDWAAADAAYRAVLQASPGDATAKAGLAMVGLYSRTEGLDPVQVLAEADAAPSDPAAQSLAADILVLHNRPVEAFARLVGIIRFAGPDVRDPVRKHLLELFDVVGADDPAVTRARLDLANALF